MDMEDNIRRGIVFLFALALVLGLSRAPVANAEEYCVDAFVSSIDPTSVGINEDFTVGILIDNCGEGASPENITFELMETGPHISVKEP